VMGWGKYNRIPPEDKYTFRAACLFFPGWRCEGVAIEGVWYPYQVMYQAQGFSIFDGMTTPGAAELPGKYGLQRAPLSSAGSPIVY
jgi:hypothetical protein